MSAPEEKKMEPPHVGCYEVRGTNHRLRHKKPAVSRAQLHAGAPTSQFHSATRTMEGAIASPARRARARGERMAEVCGAEKSPAGTFPRSLCSIARTAARLCEHNKRTRG